MFLVVFISDRFERQVQVNRFLSMGVSRGYGLRYQGSFFVYSGVRRLWGVYPKPIFDALAKKPGTPLWLQLTLRSRLADSGAQLTTNLQALKALKEPLKEPLPYGDFGASRSEAARLRSSSVLDRGFFWFTPKGSKGTVMGNTFPNHNGNS